MSGIVKVWNKPSKQLMESKKPIYEDDLEFIELLNKSPNSDFRELWAEREMKCLEKLSQSGIKCATGIAFEKNVLIMSRESQSLMDDEDFKDITKNHPKYKQSCFNDVFTVSLYLLNAIFRSIRYVFVFLHYSIFYSMFLFIDIKSVVHFRARSCKSI